VFGHFRRSCRTVHSNDIDIEGGKDIECSQGFAAKEHRSGGLNRDLRDQDNIPLRTSYCGSGSIDSRFQLKKILGRLDDDAIRSTIYETQGILLVCIAKMLVADVTERRQFGTRADRTQDPTLLIGGLPDTVCDIARDSGAKEREFIDLIFDTVLTQICEVGTEGICLDCIDSGIEILAMDLRDEIGSSSIEDLIAPLVTLEICEGRVCRLDHGAHRSISDHGSMSESKAQ
jgi:hypothetical protein